MTLEGRASAGSGFVNEVPVVIQLFEKGLQRTYVSGIDLPAAVEFPDDSGGRGFRGTDVQDGAAGGHDAVSFGGDHRAEGGGFLGDQTEVRLGEAAGEFGAGTVGLKLNVGELMMAAEGLEFGTLGATSGEDETEASVVAEGEHGVANGAEVMGESKVTGVVDVERARGEWEGSDLIAVGPIVADVDFVRRDAVGDEAVFHVITESDDAVGAVAGPVGECSGDASGDAVAAKDAEVGGDVGVDVHFPDEVAGATDLEEVPEEGEERRGCHGDGGLGGGDAESVPGRG